MAEKFFKRGTKVRVVGGLLSELIGKVGTTGSTPADKKADRRQAVVFPGPFGSTDTWYLRLTDIEEVKAGE